MMIEFGDLHPHEVALKLFEALGFTSAQVVQERWQDVDIEIRPSAWPKVRVTHVIRRPLDDRADTVPAETYSEYRLIAVKIEDPEPVEGG